jgi:hypothetical protein
VIGHTELQLAMRTKLRTLVVVTTGTITLRATATGYERAAGSFYDDGFSPGMELTPAGFATNTPRVITSVTPAVITVSGAVPVEAFAGGRSLTVGLPSSRSWEGLAFSPTSGVPWIEEQYLPGPEAIMNDGYQGRYELRPIYAPRVYVQENVGVPADAKYADAIRRLFAPGTSLPLPTGSAGDVCIALDKPAVTRGQRLHTAVAGWTMIPVTIPFRALTVSSLP